MRNSVIGFLWRSEGLRVKRGQTDKVRDDFDDVLNREANHAERILLRRRRKDVAAIVSVEDLAVLEEIEDRIDLREALAVLEEVEREGTVPWETVKKNAGL